MKSSKMFNKGDKVEHKNLGEGIFIKYDLHENECVVEFTDELGYTDDLRVSISMLNKL